MIEERSEGPLRLVGSFSSFLFLHSLVEPDLEKVLRISGRLRRMTEEGSVAFHIVFAFTMRRFEESHVGIWNRRKKGLRDH